MTSGIYKIGPQIEYRCKENTASVLYSKHKIAERIQRNRLRKLELYYNPTGKINIVPERHVKANSWAKVYEDGLLDQKSD
jgi:hypothetical protein